MSLLMRIIAFMVALVVTMTAASPTKSLLPDKTNINDVLFAAIENADFDTICAYNACQRIYTTEYHGCISEMRKMSRPQCRSFFADIANTDAAALSPSTEAIINGALEVVHERLSKMQNDPAMLEKLRERLEYNIAHDPQNAAMLKKALENMENNLREMDREMGNEKREEYWDEDESRHHFLKSLRYLNSKDYPAKCQSQCMKSTLLECKQYQIQSMYADPQSCKVRDVKKWCTKMCKLPENKDGWKTVDYFKHDHIEKWIQEGRWKNAPDREMEKRGFSDKHQRYLDNLRSWKELPRLRCQSECMDYTFLECRQYGLKSEHKKPSTCKFYDVRYWCEDKCDEPENKDGWKTKDDFNDGDITRWMIEDEFPSLKLDPPPEPKAKMVKRKLNDHDQSIVDRLRLVKGDKYGPLRGTPYSKCLSECTDFILLECRQYERESPYCPAWTCKFPDVIRYCNGSCSDPKKREEFKTKAPKDRPKDKLFGQHFTVC